MYIEKKSMKLDEKRICLDRLYDIEISNISENVKKYIILATKEINKEINDLTNGN